MIRSDYLFLQFISILIWWLLLLKTTKRHLYDQPAICGSILTVPSWLPTKILLFLHKDKCRCLLFCSVPIIFGIASLNDSIFIVRLVLASTVTCYHLVETSSTHRHGEFPMLYISWGCLFHESYAHAIAHGVVVHFVLSTGIAKLAVGGLGWMLPDTMMTYLSIYGGSSTSGPLLKRLNRWLLQNSVACSLFSINAIVLEVFLVPATLFVPSPYRPVGLYLMLAMHLGIASAMSLKVGLAFLTTIPCYVYGFTTHTEFGSVAHFLSILVGLGPTIFTILFRGSLLPEDWPSCPLALFMFNGKQANVISSVLMTGDTRVVLCTNPVVEDNDLIGKPVLHHGAISLSADSAGVVGIASVYDVVLRVIGFTLLQGDLVSAIPSTSWPCVETCLEHEAEVQTYGWHVSWFLIVLERWLKTNRMIEKTSGLPLSKAYFVKIDAKANRVLQVISSRTRNKSDSASDSESEGRKHAGKKSN